MMTEISLPMKSKDKSKKLSKTKSKKLLSTAKLKDKKKKTTIVYEVKVPKPKPKIKKIVVKKSSEITTVKKRRTKPSQKETLKNKEDQQNIVNDVATETVKPRRRRGRNKKEKIYFSKATEEAIIEYNNEQDDIKRNIIYNERIKFSFEKLVENIYNTFKFTYFDSGPLEVQRDTVTHLVANIHKFQEGKGKAFSYFSIVAKNYLIFHNNNNYKRYNQHVDISDTPSEDSVCLQAEDAHHKNVQTKEFMKLLVDYWEKNITKIFTKVKDLNIAYAVLELFRSCDRIENFNKKTLYLYIREMSDCKTQQITKVLNKMKTYQIQLSKNYINTGAI